MSSDKIDDDESEEGDGGALCCARFVVPSEAVRRDDCMVMMTIAVSALRETQCKKNRSLGSVSRRYSYPYVCCVNHALS